MKTSFAITLLAVALLTVPAPAQPASDEVVYVVTIRAEVAMDRLDAVAEDLARTYGGIVVKARTADDTVLLRLPSTRLNTIAPDPRVVSIDASGSPSPGPSRIAGDVAEAVPWRAGVSYSYDGAGNVTAIGSDRFFYDVASRLVHANVNGTTRTYEYDSFGNRTKCMQGTTDCQGHTINPSNNRINGPNNHDSAGNVTKLDGHEYTYDALNMQTRDVDTASGVVREYVYTADDERIAVYTVNQWWRWTIRDTSGKVLREYMSQDGAIGKGTHNWQWAKDYVWRNGVLLATHQKPPGATAGVTYHYHLDHLGTPRRITDPSDRIVGFHDYFAFGPETSVAKSEPSLSLFKYTGHERDVSGSSTDPPLDYMLARYYSAATGRFLSSDPVISAAAITTPQLWNRYSYTANNPLRFVDPDGRVLVLSGCVENAMSPACGRQMALYLSTFGAQAKAAGKYLEVGAGGVVKFKNITGAAFAARFGMMGRATNYLVSNRAATFTMTVGKNELTERYRGGYADVYRGSGGHFGIDPKRFPTKTGFFGLTQTETGALVHEIGHAVASLIPGFAWDLGLRKGKTPLMKENKNFEAYATAFENAWRHEVLGAGPSDIRSGYAFPGDIYDSDASEMFPP